METHRTEQQTSDGQRRAQQMSLQRAQPPSNVPGYEIQEFLGSGAYGEVWVGVDQNTGRRVAIKFYTHRGSIDWSLLSREVEKLVYLSTDRYVVQLLDVGWDADPPYYVMDYIENGSLNDQLDRQGPMSVSEGCELFEEVAIGLMHAHSKGVLHCDLKPANVLLDEDHKPRLADFGQSRLTHEQAPSLGTLFYMAPEQADLEAVPDAQWDVYALGALFYSATTGAPPYRSDGAMERIDSAESLSDRLRVYRDMIRSSPVPSAHRRLKGMDRGLADIIDRCLSPQPRRRYQNVQEVLSALKTRERRKRRLPQLVLGFIGPLLLLLIMGFFGWRGYNAAMERSIKEVTKQTQDRNLHAANAVAGRAAEKIQRYFLQVEREAAKPAFQDILYRLVNEAAVSQLDVLADPQKNGQPLPERDEFRALKEAVALGEHVRRLVDEDSETPEAASWFVCDRQGTQIAAAFKGGAPNTTLGNNFRWRTYFHGGPDDLKTTREVDGVDQVFYHKPRWSDEPPPIKPKLDQAEVDANRNDGLRHILTTHLSAPFQSKATNKWKIAISTPIFFQNEKDQEHFLGILAMTVDIGTFARFKQSEEGTFFAVLIDNRDTAQKGMVLQHPIFEHETPGKKLPDRFSKYRLLIDKDEDTYEDPFGVDVLGARYKKRWIIAQAPVNLEMSGGREMLKVLVQQDYAEAIKPIRSLGNQLLTEGFVALAVVILVVMGLWAVVVRVIGETTSEQNGSAGGGNNSMPAFEATTLPAPKRRTP